MAPLQNIRFQACGSHVVDNPTKNKLFQFKKRPESKLWSVQSSERLLVRVGHDYICRQSFESEGQIEHSLLFRGLLKIVEKLSLLFLDQVFDAMNRCLREVWLKHVPMWFCRFEIWLVEERTLHKRILVVKFCVLVELSSNFEDSRLWSVDRTLND